MTGVPDINWATEADDAIDALGGSPTIEQAHELALRYNNHTLIAALIRRLQGEGVGVPPSVDAEDVAVTDTGGFYTGTDVEAVLAEIAAALEGGWPVSAHILASSPPDTESNFDNLINVQSSSGWGGRTSDNSDGALLVYNVALAAGEYSLLVGHWPHPGGGIMRFALDDGGGFVDIDDPPYSASGATVDGYIASGVFLNTVAGEGLTIPTSGVYRLRTLIDGKNASSTGFATNLRFLHMQATTLA